MPVCLHCGEIGPDGALFCGKCGYTLPQSGPDPAPVAARPAPAAVPPGPLSGLPPSAVVPPPGAFRVPDPNAARVGFAPESLPPIPPPANAKFCVRCATPIARVAVYCPVCQQPQP